LAKRRGKKRALVTVGHTWLTMAYYVPGSGTTDIELGAGFRDRLAP